MDPGTLPGRPASAAIPGLSPVALAEAATVGHGRQRIACEFNDLRYRVRELSAACDKLAPLPCAVQQAPDGTLSTLS